MVLGARASDPPQSDPAVHPRRPGLDGDAGELAVPVRLERISPSCSGTARRRQGPVANDPAVVEPTLSQARMVADGEELRRLAARALRQRARSRAGPLLGLAHRPGAGAPASRLAARLHRHGPDDAGSQNERLGYDWALQAARADHNDAAIEQLLAIAPYPRADGSELGRADLRARANPWVSITRVIHYGAGRTSTRGRRRARLAPTLAQDQSGARDRRVASSPTTPRQERSIRRTRSASRCPRRLLPAMMAYDVRGA